MNEGIVIVCKGGCGRTTEGMTSTTKEGIFEPVDGDGLSEWTCPNCLLNTDELIRQAEKVNKRSKK